MATTDLRGEVARLELRSRARRRRATPLAVSALVALGGVGALAWVAPRAGRPASTQPVASSASMAGHLSADTSALNQLESGLAALQSEIDTMATGPVPEVSSAPLPALAPLPQALPITAPPPVHVTTGASSAAY
ncbi:MAG: hypothetical protein ACYDD6_13195 [Acidimicrobiales bacterium]